MSATASFSGRRGMSRTAKSRVSERSISASPAPSSIMSVSPDLRPTAHLDAEVLRRQQGVGRRIEEPAEVVVGRIGVALLAPHREAVHVGADGHHAGRLAHHGLVEMARRKLLAQGRIACDDERIELHVAARRSARGGRRDDGEPDQGSDEAAAVDADAQVAVLSSK